MRFTTSAGSVLSEPETYDVEPYASGQTSIYVWAGAQSGHEVVSGWVSGTSGHLAGAPVTITVTPGVGTPRTYAVVSDGSGNFSLDLGKAFPVSSKVTAALPADYGAATHAYVQEAYVTLACKLPRTITHGKQTTVTCTTTPAARDGSKVTLSFKYLHAGVHVLGHGKLKNGKVSITFTTKVKNAHVQLWAYLSRTSTASYAFSRTILARIV